jgi:hypothetical protein
MVCRAVIARQDAGSHSIKDKPSIERKADSQGAVSAMIVAVSGFYFPYDSKRRDEGDSCGWHSDTHVPEVLR